MTLTAAQIAGVAQQAGFSGNNVTIAVAVALAESGGNPAATHYNSNGSTDYGLWQINSVHASLLSGGTWSDPLSNAKMAYSVWQGSGWQAWTTYKTGAYLANMGKAALASGNPDLSATAGSATSVSNPVSGLDGLSTAISTLSSAETWVRVGNVVGGMLLIGLGLAMIEHRTGMLAKTAEKAAAGAAVLA
jgi:hypothetical protein